VFCFVDVVMDVRAPAVLVSCQVARWTPRSSNWPLGGAVCGSASMAKKPRAGTVRTNVPFLLRLVLVRIIGVVDELADL
jgi:hypothetical protein